MSVATEYEMPIFGEALGEFGGFLESQGVSSNLLWVFREDVCWCGRQLFAKVPVPDENPGLVEKLYERGVKRGLGIRLDVLCLLGARPCCYIWLPTDEEDASYAMLSGLKFGVPTEPMDAQAVESGLLWRFYKWREHRERFKGIVEQIPRRAG